MIFRDLAYERFDLEDKYLQTMRHQPGMASEVHVANRRMRVLEKIQYHRGSAFELLVTPDVEELFKREVDKIALVEPVDLEAQAIAIDGLIKSFAPATEDIVLEQRAAE